MKQQVNRNQGGLLTLEKALPIAGKSFNSDHQATTFQGTKDGHSFNKPSTATRNHM